MAYGDFKDLPRITASDKALRDKAFTIAKNPNCDKNHSELPSMTYILFDQKSAMCKNKSFATHTGTKISSDLDSENQPTVSRKITKANF